MCGICYYKNDKIFMNDKIITIFDEKYEINKNLTKYSIKQVNDIIIQIITSN
jgi:hypothetical protein